MHQAGFSPVVTLVGESANGFTARLLSVLVRLGRMAPESAGLCRVPRVFTRGRIAATLAVHGLQRTGCARLFSVAALWKRDGRWKLRRMSSESAERRSCFVVLDGLTSLALLGYGRELLFGMVQELDDATATRRQSSRGACEAQPLKRTATGQPLNGGKRSADAEAN